MIMLLRKKDFEFIKETITAKENPIKNVFEPVRHPTNKSIKVHANHPNLPPDKKRLKVIMARVPAIHPAI